MQIIVDTQLLLWSVAASKKLPDVARDLITHPGHVVFYSAASVWEIAVKSRMGMEGFTVEVPALLRAFETAGFDELPVKSAHVARVLTLPTLHQDAIDRLLVAQAQMEPALLLTNDAQLAQYGDHVRVV